ncbi:MAG: AraC family transcriptional regulator [Parvularculaceae bacterium]
MSNSALYHCARQHRTGKTGVEAASITSNRHFPRHAHDGYGLGLLDKGAHRTWSSFGDVQSEAGDIVTVNPEEMHDGVPIANSVRSWRMIYFERDLINSVIGEETRRPLEFARPVLRDKSLNGRFAKTFSLLIADDGEPLAVDEAIARLLAIIRERYSTKPPPVRRGVSSVRRAREMIDDNPSTALTLEELAKASGVSRFQLIRSFAKETGITPYAYQMQRRVSAARRFIAEGVALADTSCIAGFADQSHMTRAFVRQFGVTPARYQAALGVAPERSRNIVQDRGAAPL